MDDGSQKEGYRCRRGVVNKAVMEGRRGGREQQGASEQGKTIG